MQDYSIEVGAVIEDIVIDSVSALVRLNVRGLSKSYGNFNRTAIDELRAGGFVKGEKVRFLYAGNDNWTLRRYTTAQGMDRYLKREE